MSKKSVLIQFSHIPVNSADTSIPCRLTNLTVFYFHSVVPPQMLPGFENLLFAHSSWYTYAATMRIYKHWDFRVTEPHTATGKLSFSSYPGMCSIKEGNFNSQGDQ